MDTPPGILAIALQRANTDIGNSIVNNEDVRQRIESMKYSSAPA
jgi:hypothetical protein